MINKAILGPFIAAIALFVKQVFGYDVPVEWQDGIINLVLFAVMVIGLFMHPKRVKTEENTITNEEKMYH